jgi:hypothetical protein
MTKLGKPSPFLGVIFFALLALTGCVANHAYRVPNPLLREHAPESTHNYSLAFVEFDDVGEMFMETTKEPACKYQNPEDQDNTELGQAICEIKRINRGEQGRAPVYVLFTHGWKNNASDSSGNVWGFRTVLQSLADQLAPSGRPVMGVYIGWRGAVTNIPVVKEFSFWNRKDTATRIPGAHLTEAVRRITLAAKSNQDATLLVVGHSFGGLVMERTLTQAMVEMILENEPKIDAGEPLPMPDLTVLLNEAGPATEAKEFLDFLTREHLEYVDDKKVPHPLVLSMTSTGDTATRIIFPVGQFLGKHGLDTRKYETPDEFGETDQNHYFLHTTANSPKLISHAVTKSATVPKCEVYSSFHLDDANYYICALAGDARTNRTPYWVMQIPPEFVPDHSTIFKPELRALLRAFLQQRGTVPQTGQSLTAQAAPQASSAIKLQRRSRPELKRTDQ